MPRKRKSAETPKDIEDAAGVAKKPTPWEPHNWRALYDNIKKMRSNRDAPVDVVGCDRLADEHAEPKVSCSFEICLTRSVQTFRLQILLALMLSSQTKDQVTAGAMDRLIQRGCTLEELRSMDQDELQQLIYPVGFYKVGFQFEEFMRIPFHHQPA